MKKILLDTKWIGALFLLIAALWTSYIVSNFATGVINASAPRIFHEASGFLPITFENGAIVSPQDVEIRKNYGTQAQPIWVVLDTRSDELSSSDIKEQGLYISRKYIYGVTSQKTEIRDFADMPNMVIDQEVLDNVADWVQQKSGKYIFVTFFISLLIYMALAVLLYTALIHLLIGKAMKVTFGRTLRVTTLSYSLLFVLSILVISFGIIITFVLLLLANYLVAKYIPQTNA